MASAEIEDKLIAQGFKAIAGIDESGVGSLAGPVYAAIVIFSPGFDFSRIPGLNDSKQKSEANRNKLYELIKQYALDYCVASASVREIDVHNIYWARFVAVRRALNNLNIKPDYLLMDGNAKVPQVDTPQSAIVKGDAKSFSIAAASILAKVDRDRYMIKIADEVHEDYGWKSNKAYGCKGHIKALEKHGKTKWHRARFIRKINVGGGDGK